MGKGGSITALVIAQVAILSLWFVSAAILPAMQAELPMSAFRQAALSSAVQAGFVIGALVSALSGLADRFDPRRIVAIAALLAATANAGLLLVPIGSLAAVALRLVTGALLAAVYPLGMKIAVGWGREDRGLLVGLLVAGLTFGSALPHLFAAIGAEEWRLTVVLASLAATLGGLTMFPIQLGPFHGQSQRFRLSDVFVAWKDARIRYAIAGYLGHMWELYAMWAWVGVFAAASFATHLAAPAAAQLATWTAFVTIAAGGIASALAGPLADRIGKGRVASLAMWGSGSAALATAASFGGPIWLTILAVTIWGFAIVPDSGQFSALVADYAPPDKVGSLMTLQTALGFGLTVFVVQTIPWLAQTLGWSAVLVILALGPAFGIWAMARLAKVIAVAPGLGPVEGR